MAKIIKEAAEQSYRLTIPNIKFKSNLKEIYGMISQYDYVLIAYEEQAKHGELSQFKQTIKQFKTQDRVLIIFGPEGGLSDSEISLFGDVSTIVGLGPRILRAETAPLYALSAVSYEKIIGVKIMSTVAFHTLGCKVNHYETEAIWQLFKDANYERVEFETNADVFVINTCTVTNTGDKKSSDNKKSY